MASDYPKQGRRADWVAAIAKTDVKIDRQQVRMAPKRAKVDALKAKLAAAQDELEREERVLHGLEEHNAGLRGLISIMDERGATRYRLTDKGTVLFDTSEGF